MASDIGQASLNLTPEEKRAYGQLFQQADTDGVGVVTGDVAVKFFEKTRLDPTVLGEIWQIGDKENRGFLTPAGFSTVLRLIGHCQAGRTPSADLANQPGPIPRFDGIVLAGQNQPAPLPQQNSGSGPIRVPPLAPEKAIEYATLFDKAGARNGLLGGDAAKQVFERSRLPNDVLGQIWNLADKDARGSLNATDFVVAMHLLTSMRSGAMRALPQTLPAGLYDAASRRATVPPPAASASRQATGRTQSPLSQSFGSPSMSAQSTGNDWLISPQEKANYDRAFASIDGQGRGHITGDQAVPFFSNSGLGEETLAQIWDLADINSEGQLNRDEFAVAMYLIRQQRGKSGDHGSLPTTLPLSLIPPSMRQRIVPAAVSTAPNFENAAPAAPNQKSAADDLFGLDAMPSDPPTSKSEPFPPKGPANPQSSREIAPQQPQERAAASPFGAPFVPSSSFGRGLAAQDTGDTTQSTQSPAKPANNADDLLGDTDPEVNKKFNAETTELANMSNQIGTLRTQMQEVQTKRTDAQRDLTNSSNQKKDLEERLARFRAQYEEEIRAVKGLESRLTTSRAETTKLSQDLATLESTHQELRTQHQQLSAAFEADQRENLELKDRIRALNGEIATLRPALEKLRSDARQQKGMTAINKKQLATNEAEKDKLQNEQKDLEKAAAERVAEASDSREPPFSNIPSPAASTTSAHTNPFFRKSPPPAQEAMSPSVFRQENRSDARQSAFDSYFAPQGQSAKAGPPPPTTFGTAAEPSTGFDAPETFVSAASPEPALSGYQTPPMTGRSASMETPSSADPPPPPQSRQITSSALPLRTAHITNDSPASSVKAIPPASRSGFSDVEDVSKESGRDALGGAGGHNDELTVQAPAVSQDPSSIPGAFPGETESPIGAVSSAPIHTDEVTPQNSKAATNGALVGDASQQTQFDSAFASASQTVGPDSGATNDTKKAPAASSEFPPIEDIQQDESDSESETGFGDHFNAAGGSNMHQSAISDAAQPPAANIQASPPSYEAAKAVDPSQADDSGHFPKEYSGLLPPRESSQGSPEPAQQHSSAAGINASSVDSQSHPVSAELRGPVAARVPSQAPADEFDAAFDDLDEANEEDEQGPGDFKFGTSVPNRENDDDFNPTFDSPVPSKTNTMNDSIQHTPTASTSRAYEQPPSTAASQSAPQPSSTGGGQAPAAAVSQADTSHDWDAIFAGLDKPVGDAPGSGSPFALEEPGASNRLAAPTGHDGKGRPSGPARAISTGTEHDDPILKTLTGMGYPRGKALAALEQFDYNLDKAADHLAFSK